MLLRVQVFVFVLTTIACGQIKTSTPLPPAKLKSETLRIVRSLEVKPEWLFGPMACPASIVSSSGTKPLYMSEGCKDEPNRCLDRCKAEDPTACYALALLMEDYVEPNDQVAQALYFRSCKLGIISGCTNRAANIAEFKLHDPEEQKCATDTFEKTCDQNDPWGCTMLGLALIRGDGRTKDNVEAARVLRKACEISKDKSGAACQNALALIDQISKEKP